MATKIVTKNSSTASAVPTASDLVQGELAVNVADKRLFTEDNGGSIVELGTNPSTIDINAGTIDGTVIGGSSAAAGTFTTGQFNTSVNVNGTVTADGVQVGNTSDAFSAVYIISSATGESELRMGDTDTDAGSIAYTNSDDTMTFRAAAGARMSLNSTGIDVTGTATMDGLSVENNTTDVKGTVKNTLTSGTRTATLDILPQNDGAYGVSIQASGGSGTGTFQFNNKNIMKFDFSNDISFYEDTGTTAKFFWDASKESLGIGTTSLTPTDGSNIELSSATSSRVILDSTGSGGRKWTMATGTNGSLDFYDYDASAYRMRIDSSGRVGIGTSSPSSYYSTTLVVDAPDEDGITVVSPTTGTGYLMFADGTSGNERYRGYINYGHANDDMQFATSGLTRMRIDSSGNVGIGISPAAKFDVLLGSTSRLLLRERSSRAYIDSVTETNNAFDSLGINGSEILFETGGTERMRIDSSGNLLVGKTTTGVSGAGVVLRGGGELFVTRAGDVMNLNRLTSDGEIAVFRKDGTAIGSIGTYVNLPYIGKADVNLLFDPTGPHMIPRGTNGGARDAAINLGSSSNRFKDVYRSGSTYSSSDRNMKQDIRDLTDAERNVAVACKGLLKAFRFIDAVEKDGDDACIHFGVIAQELAEAFEAEGLDANDYQVYKSATTTDEDGNEQTRLNVCYENLLAFIISAI